jgi:hypothetical protein
MPATIHDFTALDNFKVTREHWKIMSGIGGGGADDGPAGTEDDPVAGVRDDGGVFPAAGAHPQSAEDGHAVPDDLWVELLLHRFGPNATTFVYPSEIFPVRVRTTGHGIAAAMGKLGGFLGVFVFPYLMHWKGLMGAESAAAIASVLGLVMTVTMLPEPMGKSLEEIETEAASPVERLAKAA